MRKNSNGDKYIVKKWDKICHTCMCVNGDLIRDVAYKVIVQF